MGSFYTAITAGNRCRNAGGTGTTIFGKVGPVARGMSGTLETEEGERTEMDRESLPWILNLFILLEKYIYFLNSDFFIP